MTTTDPESRRQRSRTHGVPQTVALALFAIALGAAALAIWFASQATEAQAQAELLNDGVNRSGLPTEAAVGLARLAESRSAPVPESEMHHHDHGSHDHELTPEQQEEFDAQWAEAVASVERFDTLAEAIDLGYVRSSGNTDGAGEHWTNWDLVDRPFDPANPSQLLFEELKRGEPMELIAFSYWVASDGAPDGFAGELDSWHRHLGVCFMNGMIWDENMLRHECEGDWLNGVDLWMIHAWVVPGVDNEYGIFHNVNPLLCEHACGLEN